MIVLWFFMVTWFRHSSVVVIGIFAHFSPLSRRCAFLCFLCVFVFLSVWGVYFPSFRTRGKFPAALSRIVAFWMNSCYVCQGSIFPICVFICVFIFFLIMCPVFEATLSRYVNAISITIVNFSGLFAFTISHRSMFVVFPGSLLHFFVAGVSWGSQDCEIRRSMGMLKSLVSRHCVSPRCVVLHFQSCNFAHIAQIAIWFLLLPY